MSQYADIIAHCKTRKHLTTMVAMQRYGVCRLSQRIIELEQRGYVFSRRIVTIINRHGRPCRFTAYSLEAGI